METVKIKDVNLASMKLLSNSGKTSTVYIEDGICYKILDKLGYSYKQELLKKLMDIDGIELNGIIFPKQLIMDNDELIGYTTESFNESECLFDYFTKDRFVDSNDILKVTKEVSLLLKDIHNTGIILQDLSFENILIDKNSNIKICDIDSCTYNKNMGHYISGPMASYLRYHKNAIPDINENFDRQSLFFSMIMTLYHKVVHNMKEYDKLSNNIDTLKNLRETMNSLLVSIHTWVPYLDEVIKDDDHFIIDRNNQVSSKKVLLKDYSI